MSNDAVLYDVKDAIATITMNRPKAMNALNMEVAEGLSGGLKKAADDPDVRCVVITSSSANFMAGGDLVMFKGWVDEGVEVAQERLQGAFDGAHDTVRLLKTMDKPVIASVAGGVAGYGLSLMLACDLAIAADTTFMTLAYIKIGTSPDGGSTYSLPRLVGTRKAMEIALLGDNFDAAEAERLGLVNRVVPADQLEAETAKLATRLANGPTRAYGRTKRLINASHETSMNDQLKAEEDAFRACAGNKDFNEGLSSFLEKRKPDFKGE